VFQPGQSGNPGGRPKKAREVADLMLDASDLAAYALIKVLEAEMNEEDPNPQIIAMLFDRIMDRGFGRPGQSPTSRKRPGIPFRKNSSGSFSGSMIAMIQRKQMPYPCDRLPPARRLAGVVPGKCANIGLA
jgi:hypothetical protein